MISKTEIKHVLGSKQKLVQGTCTIHNKNQQVEQTGSNIKNVHGVLSSIGKGKSGVVKRNDFEYRRKKQF